LISLGCESFNGRDLKTHITDSGRPGELLIIQRDGGTRATIEAGRAWVEQTLAQLGGTPRADIRPDELVIGTICGGSDATSGLAANPAMGRAFDMLVELGAACIFEETGELIGCEGYMAERAQTPELGQAIIDSVAKAHRHYHVLGHASISPGNAAGGLTTIEEKSMGAYAKSGAAPISGLLKPGDLPPKGGLYLLDMVSDGDVRFGFPSINDTEEIGELIACGAHIVLFSTGRGSVVGSAISPVIKVCGNPETFARLWDDMDIDAGRILEGEATLDEVGEEIRNMVLAVAQGTETNSEALGHQEFCMKYKRFEATGPECLPL
ncbi:MAG: UxaA family hydrolase, partial [Alphaproteobacteria bacterium]|nr:UxaA family hydrolase [Alphaproteobacteria bacterium]